MSLDPSFIDYELLLPSSLLGETSESVVNITSGSVISKTTTPSSEWTDYNRDTMVYSFRDEVNNPLGETDTVDNTKNEVPCFSEYVHPTPFLTDLELEEREKIMNPEPDIQIFSGSESVSKTDQLSFSSSSINQKQIQKNTFSMYESEDNSGTASGFADLLLDISPEISFSSRIGQSFPINTSVGEPMRKTPRLQTSTQQENLSSFLPFSSFYPPTFEEVGLVPHSSSPLTFELRLDSPKDETSLKLCPVCGNEAGKHVHYGGKACTSCRAFFRRSVQNEAYKGFACNQRGSCKIDSKSWKSCRWCRFQKCLTSGMKPGYVLNETERQVRHEKRTSGGQKKQSQGGQNVESNAMIPVGESTSTALVQCNEPPSAELRLTTILQSTFAPMASDSEKLLWAFSKDEHDELWSMLTNFRRNITKTVMKFYSKNQYFFKEMMRALYLRTNIRYETYRQMEVRWSLWLSEMCIEHTPLGTLNPEDYSLLLKHNLPVLQVVIQSILLGNPMSFRTSSMAEVLMRVITLQSVEYGDIDVEKEMFELNNIMSELNVGQELPERPISYDQVFHSPWAASADIEERHAALTFQISPWPTDISTTLHPEVDRLQVFLLANVIMLSTDLVKVKDTKKVAKLQDHFLSMLHRYLKYKYNRDANSKLVEGIMMSSLAREAQEIRRQRLPV